MKWSIDDLLRLDKIYAEEGVAFHQRPLRAAMDILGDGFVLGPGSGDEVSAICRAYEQAFPEVKSTWPGAGIGLCASLDRVRKVTLPVFFGDQSIEPWQGLGFQDNVEWWTWCRRDPVIAAGTSFAFADLHDIAGGFSSVGHDSGDAVDRWTMALSNLEDVSNVLVETHGHDSVLQPIHLVAELSIKAALLWLGATDAEMRRPGAGHDVTALLELLKAKRPHRDDTLVTSIIARLPSYTASRYKPSASPRINVVRLAVGVQFVAASTLRRVTGIDLAAEMETGGWPSPRPPLFPD